MWWSGFQRWWLLLRQWSMLRMRLEKSQVSSGGRLSKKSKLTRTLRILSLRMKTFIRKLQRWWMIFNCEKSSNWGSIFNNLKNVKLTLRIYRKWLKTWNFKPFKTDLSSEPRFKRELWGMAPKLRSVHYKSFKSKLETSKCQNHLILSWKLTVKSKFKKKNTKRSSKRR